MATNQILPLRKFDWQSALQRTAPGIVGRAAACDQAGSFVADNMKALHEEGFFTAAVPIDLGGGGCDQRELGAMLRILAQSCGSTALALSMHTHLVATLAWRWHRDPAATASILQRVVDEKLTLVSSGGSDWLDGSCRLERAEGGYRISGRKVFASGSPAGDLLMTTGRLEEEDGRVTILHFPLALHSDAVRLIDSWDTLGMRGTGSLDIEISGAFIPEAVVSVRRPAGKWHPAMHLVTMIAFPLIYAVYVGLAESARDQALAIVASRSASGDLELVVGEMETELAAARLALADMLDASAEGEPGAATSNRVMTGRTLVARAAIRAVEKAMEAAGGAGFYRRTGIERLFRDVQAARYHPLQEKAQARLAARVALGCDIDGSG